MWILRRCLGGIQIWLPISDDSVHIKPFSIRSVNFDLQVEATDRWLHFAIYFWWIVQRGRETSFRFSKTRRHPIIVDMNISGMDLRAVIRRTKMSCGSRKRGTAVNSYGY